MKKNLKVLSAVGVAALATIATTACEKEKVEPDPIVNPEPEPTPEPVAKTGTLDIDATGAKTTFLFGEKFDAKGLVVKANGTTLEEGKYTVVSRNVDLTKEGEYTVTVAATVGEKTFTGTYKVKVVEAIWEEISTVQQLLDARKAETSGATDGYNRKSYKLTQDLDLAGVTLEDSDVIFTGTFNGNGHTIKNATYSTSTSKQGLLFNKLAGNAIVKNVKFFNCTAVNQSETIAIVAGEVNDDKSNVTVENVEFSMCNVTSPNNYAGMVIARNETGKITVNFNKITVKNFSSVTNSTYGGGLFGDIIAGSSINIKNCDVDMNTTTSANGSMLVGRNRGADVDVENVIIRGDLLNGAGSTGYVTGGGKDSSKIIIKNVVILGNAHTSGDLLLGNSKATTLTLENIYYVDKGDAKVDGRDEYTQITADTFTADWAKNTLKLGDEFEAENSSKKIKLVGSSSNLPGSSATVSGLSLATGTVKKEFFQTDTFNTTGLAVSISWSDGCVTASDDNTTITTVVKNANGEVVDTTSLATVATGTYTVEVSASVEGKGSAKATYNIDVVAYDNVIVETGDSKLCYVEHIDETFDGTNTYVFLHKTNGTRKLVKNPTFTIKKGETVVEKFDTTGEYTVSVTTNGLTSDSFKVYFVSPVSNGVIANVTVNASKDNGAIDGEGATASINFKTLELALNYLDSMSSSLDANAEKVIKLAPGTYREKVTVNVPNVTIIGTGTNREDTVLVWNTAEGSMKLDDSKAYSMDCATLIVTDKAKGFTLSNITVKNDFDYLGSKLADKQAFALQCDADQATFNNVYFYGVQDTLYANTGRQYYINCRIDGAVDYVFGQNDVVALFDNCVFHSVTRYNVVGETKTPSNNNGYVFAPKSNASDTGLKYNYVVRNSRFEADEDVVDGSMSIARPWGKDGGVAILNSTFTKAYSTNAYGALAEDGKTKLKARYEDMSGNSPEAAHFFEYNNTNDGTAVAEVAGVKLLTAEQADTYTAANIFGTTNGAKTFTGEWNPVNEANEAYALNDSRSSIVAYIYNVKDTYTSGTDTALNIQGQLYEIVGNTTSGSFTITNQTANSSLVYKNEVGEVVNADAVLANVGKYTVSLVYNEQVVKTANFEVAASNITEHTAKTSADAWLTDTSFGIDSSSKELVEGKEYSCAGGEIKVAVYAKTDKNSGARQTPKIGKGTSVPEVTVDGTKYSSVFQLSGGKASVKSSGVDNAAKITVAHKGKLRLIVGNKKSTATETSDSSKYTNPAIWNSNYEVVSSYGKALNAWGEGTVVEFDVEAGTYYFGAKDNDGLFLYAIEFVYMA
ncbi:MAG: bacterial Ig-like domain-containing protein [Acholeplasmatales bacterium]|nr:bacterial Ig-like domain-containing protein [Acholeplasmatales bacterium]